MYLKEKSKLEKYLYPIAFATMPILNMISKIIIGHAYKLRHYITLFIPILIFSLIGYFASSFYEKRKLSTKYMSIKVAGLVAIDQLTKLIINRFLGSGIINIPGNMYMIKIVKNEQITALFNIMGLSLPAWITTVARFLVLVFVWLFLRYCERKYKRDSYLILTEIFLFAMVISSIIDSSLWGYTLDFIVSRDLQAIDIKDIYAYLGIGSLSVYIIGNELFSRKRT